MGNICMRGDEIERNKILETFNSEQLNEYNKRNKEILNEEVRKYVQIYMQNNSGEFPINSYKKTTIECFTFKDDFGVKHYKYVSYDDLLVIIKQEMEISGKKYTTGKKFIPNHDIDYPTDFYLIVNVIN